MNGKQKKEKRHMRVNGLPICGALNAIRKPPKRRSRKFLGSAEAGGIAVRTIAAKTKRYVTAFKLKTSAKPNLLVNHPPNAGPITRAPFIDIEFNATAACKFFFPANSGITDVKAGA
jgi:hypothetical protein